METWTSFNIATNFGRGWPLGVVRLLTSLQGSEMTFWILFYDSQKHVDLCTTLQPCLRTLLRGLPTLLIVMLALAACTRLCCSISSSRPRTEHALSREDTIPHLEDSSHSARDLHIDLRSCVLGMIFQPKKPSHAFPIIVCVMEPARPVLNMARAASPFLDNVFNIDADYWRYRPS